MKMRLNAIIPFMVACIVGASTRSWHLAAVSALGLHLLLHEL